VKAMRSKPRTWVMPVLPGGCAELRVEGAAMERRGIHVGMRGASGLPAIERLVSEIAPSLDLNYVILEVNDKFQYQSHPEAGEADSMSAADARGLAAAARANGVTLVPMYNCLGHQSWKDKSGALLRSHPEFNEAPEMDVTAKDFYCMSWCPTHPEVNSLVFDLFDELIEAFEAEAFHVGLDEVLTMGECPRCKGTPNGDLFAKAVNDYHGHLVGARGVEMQMWGDRLLDAKTMGYGLKESSENGTHEAIDKVSKDIVMCDWHYEIRDEFPSVKFFQEQGFRVWPGGWNKEESIKRLVEVARRDATPLMLGYLATTWSDTEKVVAGLGGQPLGEEDARIAAIVEGVKLGAKLAQG